MIVCQCARVNGRQVKAAVSRGCVTVKDLCRETGAGSGCGACVEQLRTLILKHAASPVSDRRIRAAESAVGSAAPRT